MYLFRVLIKILCLICSDFLYVICCILYVLYSLYFGNIIFSLFGFLILIFLIFVNKWLGNILVIFVVIILLGNVLLIKIVSLW